MSTIEDRLTAALSARADLVQPDDLRYAEPPAVPSRAPRLAAYALAAAACAAAVAAPFVLTGGPGDEDVDVPPATTSPTPNGDDVPGSDWSKAYSYPRAYDVDGDGAPDEVVIRTQVDDVLPAGVRRVEAQLSTGGVAAVLLDYDTYDLTMVEPVEVDGEPGDELLYYRGTEEQEMGLLDLQDGALVDLSVPDDPGLTSQLDDRGRLRSRWVEGEALFSSRSIEEGFENGDGGKPIPRRYGVDVWSWALVAGALVPVEEEQRCVESPGQENPLPCTAPGRL